MIRRLPIILGLCCLLMPMAALAAGAGEPVMLAGLRVVLKGGDTQIELDAEAPLAVSVEPVQGGAAVELPPVVWSNPPKLAAAGIVAGYSFVDRGSDGALLTFATLAPVSVVRNELLVPGPDRSRYRLVVDLRPAAQNASTPDPVKPIVMLDPGHGGIDPGTTGPGGVQEKAIVLALAQAVKARLDRDGAVTTLLSRDTDAYVSLSDRVATARLDHAELFVSLHANSSPLTAVHGFSIYTLSQTASDVEAQSLADIENKSDLIAGIDLSQQSPEVGNILVDLAQRETMRRSAQFAAMVVDEVGRTVRDLEASPRHSAGFAVLKALDMPSVLIESGYLSNPVDERALRDPAYRGRLADAIAQAIEAYFRTVGKLAQN